MTKSRFIIAGLALLGTPAAGPSDAFGDDFTWTGAVGQDFQDPDNWTPEGRPDDPGDRAIFDGVGGTVVNVGGTTGATNRDLIVTNADVVLRAPIRYSLTDDLQVGGVDILTSSSLTLDLGRFRSNRGLIGGAAAPGAVAVSGNSASWEVDSTLVVGNGGVGTLSIDGGADVSADGTFVLGNGFVGDLSVSGGSSLSTGYAVLGTGGSQGIGAAEISGPGSNWTNVGALTLGASSLGFLSIADRAQVSTGSLTIGREDDSSSIIPPADQVVVQGPGTRLDVEGGITVGDGNELGRLAISGGADVTAESLDFLGLPIGDDGELADFPSEILSLVGPGSSLTIGGDVLLPIGPISVADHAELIVGNLTASSLAFGETTFQLGLDASDPDSMFSPILVEGDLDLGGLSLLDLSFEGGPPVLGSEQLLFDVGGTLTGRFFGLDEGDLVGVFGGREVFISYTAGDGNDIAISVIPEPGSATLALVGLGALAWRARRARR